MELYLMQHGRAVPETEDPDQPLSKDGVTQVKDSAVAMRILGINPDTILCSPKKRSHQTAALVAERVNYPYSDIIETATVKAMAPADDALFFLRRFRENRSVLIAGHLPSLANIASRLLGGDTPVHLRFENAGLCRIDSAELAPGEGELVFHLPAAQLKILADRG